MDVTQTILTFAIVVALTGFGGLAVVYRGLRKSEPRREVPKG